jgi:hypothetical protein
VAGHRELDGESERCLLYGWCDLSWLESYLLTGSAAAINVVGESGDSVD